jgi:tetratricopeptide (TPR) repeat protein
VRIGRHLVTALAFAAALAAIDEWCVLPYHCNVAKGALAVRTDANAAEYAGDLSRAHARDTLDSIRPLRRGCPRDLDLLMLQATNEGLMGHFDEAIASYREALAVEMRPEIYLELAKTEYAAGRMNDAIADGSRAILFHPFMIAEVKNQILKDELDRRVLKTQ